MASNQTEQISGVTTVPPAIHITQSQSQAQLEHEEEIQNKILLEKFWSEIQKKNFAYNKSLYLVYNLVITQIDPSIDNSKEVVEFKDNINFELIKSMETTWCNDEVRSKLARSVYCPLVNSIDKEHYNYYYSEITLANSKIKILFFEFLNSALITPHIIKNDSTILTAVDRTIKYLNNLTFPEKNFFKYKIDQIMTMLVQPRIYNLTSFSFETHLKTKLFRHQRDNVHWMLKTESEKGNYVVNDKIFYFNDGRIFSYNTNKFVDIEEINYLKLNGGVIIDQVGTGKTLQFISLILASPHVRTLIVVPNHLKDRGYWEGEFDKHVGSIPENVMIVSFNEFLHSADLLVDKINENFDRIIVDEIHELYSIEANENIYEKAVIVKCRNKWGLTATPFPVENSIYKIIKYLSSETNCVNYLIERFNYNVDTYVKIFRKNTLEMIEEVTLPEINIHNLFINFSGPEQIVYNAEIAAGNSVDKKFLSKLCCDAQLSSSVTESGEYFTNWKDIIAQFEKKCMDVEKIITELLETFEKAKSVYEILTIPNPELRNNISHLERKIEENTLILKDRKRAHEYLLREFENGKVCAICLNEIDKQVNCSIINTCAHYFCQDCITYCLTSKHSAHALTNDLVLNCPMCRGEFTMADVSVVANGPANLKYPSKIIKLLEFLEENHDKVLIYTQYEKMGNKIKTILQKHGYGTIIYQDHTDIDNFRDGSDRVLVLGSGKNASGLDLTFVNKIIIYEPIDGDYSFLRDIEKQIIGRIYRIGQTQVTNVYRFIINDSIESQIYQNSID